jgi:hypothetical protein
MAPDIIFSLCNSIALIGWLILIIVSPFRKDTDKLLIGIIVTLLSIIYVWCISRSFNTGDMEKFSTLDGVMSLFTNKMAVTAGWVHYLAFDMMTGIWIKNNSLKHGLKHVVIIPSLILTFMLGPTGLLLYLIIRAGKTRKYFAEN